MEYSELLEYGYLVLIGFLAGLINIVAGGGSLLTLPMLIFMGLPPQVANGTNRIGIIIQNIFAVKGFQSKGIPLTAFSVYLAISALLGSLIGAWIAVDIDALLFNRILAGVMLLIVLYLVFKKTNSINDLLEKTTGKTRIYSLIAFFFIGIYGGFIQAGVGFLIIAALSGLNKLSLVKSNAIKVFVVLIYSIAAVAVFAWNDSISWTHGLVLAIGTSAGGWTMSRYSVKKGDGFVKTLLIIMICVMAIKLWFF
ncbi:sulfite exporter TauE/SafE family protein [Flavobacteriaceae bacterium]|nr:sulfite exporter TauE/SafE family protein [Flavobacteriaceae bacterium]